jgi:hypothetical protein
MSGVCTCLDATMDCLEVGFERPEILDLQTGCYGLHIQTWIGLIFDLP